MRLVLDTNVVLPWFQGESGTAEARALHTRLLRDEVEVFVPRLLSLEVLNVAGRRWQWPDQELAGLADELDALPWIVRDPALPSIAPWVARGLTAYDATYVALAESLSCTVVTADDRMLAVAPGIAVAW